MTLDADRLRDTLGAPELAWLVERLRQRLERGESLTGAVTLSDPTGPERAAVDRLFGRRATRGVTLTVQVAQLDALLRRAELCDGIAQAIEWLTGPTVDVRALGAETEHRWTALYAAAAARVAGRPALARWMADLQSTGLLRRLCGRPDEAQDLLQTALNLVERLPAAGMPLAELAAQTAGDSHALDLGRPLGTLAVRAAAALGGVVDWGDAAARRDAWASVGVLCDELCGAVLVLNLRGDGESLTGRALRLHAEAGEPYRVSTRQLARHPPRLETGDVGPTVYVCENPNVVAAAAGRLGAASAPLICLEGQPKTAARLLLHRLTEAGVRLVYHGDFDWPGLRIANLVLLRHGAAAWRMSADDYLRTRGGARLAGAPVEARWDTQLTSAMRAAGRAVHEEQVLDELLNDLALPP
ncbi:MAG TPA: TIGR02679 family protein [Pirellulales bacterium]|nr:TIGR02679 family protein [Pirellulales bacterium]